MSNANAVQEPSMEEILASIRRIISDEETDASATPAAEAAPAPEPDVEEISFDPAAEGLESAADEEISDDDLDKLFGDGGFDAPEPDPVPAPAPEPEPVLEASVEPADDEILDLSFEDDEPLDLVEEMSPEEDDVMFSEEDMAAAIQEIDPPKPEPEVEPDLSGFAAAAVSSVTPEQLEVAATEALLSPQANASVSSAFDNLAHTILSNNARTIEDLVQEMLRPMMKGWLDENLPGIVERLVKAEIERVSRGGRH